MPGWMISTGLVFAYLLFTLVLGYFANRALTVDLEDFLLYGRKAGFVLLYLTVVASFHSAFAFLGSGGFFFRHGIGFWDAGAWTVLVGAITYVLGSRIWALGKRFGYMTPADLVADFYESEAVRVVVALVSVGFTILYIQVQAQGLGYIISVASGGRISFKFGTLILLLVAAGYLMAGGLRAVYWTDVLQGVWMYVAVWVGALVLTYRLFGGPLGLWRRLIEERPDLLTLPGPEGYFTPGMWIGMTIVFSFGIVFQPHIMIRYFTADSGKTVKWLGATTPLFLMTLYIPAALVGLGGALAMPDLEVPDRIFPELLFQYAPPWLTGIILARSDCRSHVDSGFDSALQHDRLNPGHLPALYQAGCRSQPLHRCGTSDRGRPPRHRLSTVSHDLRPAGEPGRSFGCRSTAADAGYHGSLLSHPAGAQQNRSAGGNRSRSGGDGADPGELASSRRSSWRSVGHSRQLDHRPRRITIQPSPQPNHRRAHSWSCRRVRLWSGVKRSYQKEPTRPEPAASLDNASVVGRILDD